MCDTVIRVVRECVVAYLKIDHRKIFLKRTHAKIGITRVEIANEPFFFEDFFYSNQGIPLPQNLNFRRNDNLYSRHSKKLVRLVPGTCNVSGLFVAIATGGTVNALKVDKFIKMRLHVSGTVKNILFFFFQESAQINFAMRRMNQD